MLVAIMGGLLGILMMIPLRRALIKDQHGYLKYPEGTACAEVLKAGASKESREASHRRRHGRARTTRRCRAARSSRSASASVLSLTALMKVFSFWKGTPGTNFSDTPSRAARSASDNDPTLLGVGYIIGPRIAGLMMGGGVLVVSRPDPDDQILWRRR